jgi:hypothetical protein
VSLSARAQEEIFGGSWQLGVPAESFLEPVFPADASEARRDAARRIIANVLPPANSPSSSSSSSSSSVRGGALVSFALRGVGVKKGGYRAPLADPKATGNEQYRDSVDSAFRLIVHNLLAEAVDSQTPTPPHPPSQTLANEVKECLEYVRDRVSVPRDMSSHAARLFRAHLNYLIQTQ